MTYFVTQYGNLFFTIRRIKGYVNKNIYHGTKITDAEYQKLFYSGGKRTQRNWNLNKRIDEIRIEGNANEILGRNVNSIHPK